LSAKDKLDELVQSPETCNRIDITTVTAELAGLKENDPSAVNSSGSSDAARSRGSDRGPLRILLAEDDFACRLLLQTFLSRYGECHVAVNGLEAVEAFRTAFEEDRKYDLICMDIMMPQMDGREAVRTIRAVEEAQGIHSTRGVKIFMTTTVQGIKEVFSCFNELCDAYLLKPIDLGKLLGQLKFYQLLE
jgi:two-component system chemotaxis response regulator CheY